MKKFLALCLVICVLICFVACGESNNSTNTNSNNQLQATENIADNEQTESTEEPTNLSKFEQFEKGLKDKNIQFEVNEKAATMVGAKEGYGYLFADETSVEIYLFDTSTDAYKEAAKNNKLNLVDFGVTLNVVFNDDICIYFNGEPTNKAEIQNIFTEIK